MIFPAFGAAVGYTVLFWWVSTGAILWLDRLPSKTHRWSLIAASAVAAAAMAGLVVSESAPTALAATVSFTCALTIWGWHELSFLTGLITGPRTLACPPDVTGWRRFRLASSTLIYHEAALALTAALLFALTWGSPNQVGAWTFLILMVSRLSAKLNLFLGVPNFSDVFFPDHLRYLASYLRKSAVSPLFPISLAAGGVLAAAEASRALQSGSTAFEVVSFSLLFTLTALAVVEHLFMVIPVADTALWRWAMPSAKTSDGPAVDL